MTKIFTKLNSTFFNCELSMSLWGCRGSCIRICFWFILFHTQALDKDKNRMKRCGKKRLFSTLTTKFTVEEDTVAYNEICRCLIKAYWVT